jgi:hypothetical protein
MGVVEQAMGLSGQVLGTVIQTGLEFQEIHADFGDRAGQTTTIYGCGFRPKAARGRRTPGKIRVVIL